MIRHIGHAETLVRSPRNWSVKPCMAGRAPPPFHSTHSTGVNCIFTLVLPCESFAKSSDNQVLSAYPALLRYHRALCLGRRDDRILRISQDSNVKKPSCFIVTSWIVGSTKGTIVPFNPSAFSAIKRLPLPLSAIIQWIINTNWINGAISPIGDQPLELP